MNIFIYFYDPLSCGLDELEDSLDAALVGQGQVTGSGTGEMGGNIDIEVFEHVALESDLLNTLRRALAPFNLPESSIIKIGDKVFKIMAPA